MVQVDKLLGKVLLHTHTKSEIADFDDSTYVANSYTAKTANYTATTSDRTIDVTIQWDSATTSRTATSVVATIELLK